MSDKEKLIHLIVAFQDFLAQEPKLDFGIHPLLHHISECMDKVLERFNKKIMNSIRREEQE